MPDAGKRVVVIGAGPAGLAFAAGYAGEAVVLESEAKIGGLCQSMEIDGAVFDLGGHTFHTPHNEVLEFVESCMGEPLYAQTRDARIHFGDQLIPYPFQQNFRRIADPTVVEACEQGLHDANATESEQSPSNLEEFFQARYGEGICKHFLLPYNRKLWGCDLSAIECEWTKERVAAPRGQKEAFSESGGARKPLQADTKVRYPRKGGFEEIFKAIARRVDDIRLNSRVVAIDPAAQILETTSGETYEWDRIVSTMPIDRLAKTVWSLPEEVRSLAGELEYLSLHLSLLITKQPLRNVPQRIYIHDNDVFTHKIAFNHTSSPTLQARQRHAIMGEASFSRHKSLDHHSVEKNLVSFLSRQGIVRGTEDIHDIHHVKIEYGYPVQTIGTRATENALTRHLEPLGIYSIGRFGQWKYVNSDACIRMGLDLADRLNAGN